jgi:predicted Zn-dependent protease
LLLQDFMSKNPDASFALEESFPLRSLYSNSVPLGPIMELRAQDAYTSERAGQSLDYWRDVAQQLMSDADTPEGSAVRKTYSKMVSSQANLMADHNFTADAEQAYRLAAQLEPSSPEAVYGLANLLANSGRNQEAQRVISDFQRRNPDQNSGNSFAYWTLLKQSVAK